MLGSKRALQHHKSVVTALNPAEMCFQYKVNARFRGGPWSKALIQGREEQQMSCLHQGEGRMLCPVCPRSWILLDVFTQPPSLKHILEIKQQAGNS